MKKIHNYQYGLNSKHNIDFFKKIESQINVL